MTLRTYEGRFLVEAFRESLALHDDVARNGYCSGRLKTVGGQNLFIYLCGVEGAMVCEDKRFEFFSFLGGDQAEVFQQGNHIGAAMKMTMPHCALGPFAPDHHIKAVIAGEDNHPHLHLG